MTLIRKELKPTASGAGGPGLGVFVSLKEKWVPHSFAKAGTWFFSFRERVGSVKGASLRCARAFGREEFYLSKSGRPD
jgi:hypothetical protein